MVEERGVAVVILRVLLLLLLACSTGVAQHLGFDRNDYPGNGNLTQLHQTFAFTGYWLNNPPNAKSNSWAGKRSVVEKAGLGFLLLYTGKTYQLLKGSEAESMGSADGLEATALARKEGFPSGAIIFLDQEEGGRLLPEQLDYVLAWVDAVSSNGNRAGVYCSGIAATESSGDSVVTAKDIHDNAGTRKIVYFVVNDQCPPSVGCSLKAGSPQGSGIDFADVWQFAQSPRRPDLTQSCAQTYAADGNCYPPGMKIHVDLEVASSADPSHGRTN